MEIHRRLAGGIDAPLMLLDRHGKVGFCNTPAIRLLGRDLSGISLTEGRFEDDLPVVPALAARCRAAMELIAQGTQTGLLPVHGEGAPRLFWMVLSGAGADGEPGADHHVLMLVDVTDLLHSAAAVRTVFSQVNHDLRSPLTSIAGAAELMRSGRVGELAGMQKRLVGIIEESAQKIAEILARTKADLAQRQTVGSEETA